MRRACPPGSLRLRLPRDTPAPTAPLRCAAFKAKASGELARHEMLQRGEQLASRRLEQAADAAAIGRLLSGASGRTSGGDGGAGDGGAGGGGALERESRDGLERALRELQGEWRETTAELQRVRREYDLAKWKGRWAGS